MKMHKIVFAFLVVTLSVIVVGGAACGGGAASPAPTGNQPPSIVSLVAKSQQLYPSANTEITCIAQDPDGDQLNFNWTATGGNFTGSGPTVVWNAPPNYGTYIVTVVVDDGKGASTQSPASI